MSFRFMMHKDYGVTKCVTRKASGHLSANMVAECRCETLPSRVPSSIYRKYVVSHQKIIAITVTGLLFCAAGTAASS